MIPDISGVWLYSNGHITSTTISQLIIKKFRLGRNRYALLFRYLKHSVLFEREIEYPLDSNFRSERFGRPSVKGKRKRSSVNDEDKGVRFAAWCHDVLCFAYRRRFLTRSISGMRMPWFSAQRPRRQWPSSRGSILFWLNPLAPSFSLPLVFLVLFFTDER